jgi:outer membrane protein TolC
MAGFDAEWELDLFGKSERALAAAHNDAEAKLELRNAVLTTVIADVARTYLNIRALQMRRALVRMEVAMAQRSVDLAIARFHRGPSSKSESKR